MASQQETSQLPYYNEIHQYFLNLSNFFNITSDNNEINKDRSKSTRAQKARSKLLKLSPLQFYELCTDVSDELNRRIRETGGEVKNNNTDNDENSRDYLLPKSSYHMKRNQARQKLSNLSQLRFNDLIDDILFEIKRRDYHIVISEPVATSHQYVEDLPEPAATSHQYVEELPEPAPASQQYVEELPEPITAPMETPQQYVEDLPEPIAEPRLQNSQAKNVLQKQHNESFEEEFSPNSVNETFESMGNTTTDNVNTLDTNASVPLPSMIQSSLIIPQKASIDWSDEDESDNKRSSTDLSNDNNDKGLETGDITEDFIKPKEMNNPFNNQSEIEPSQNQYMNIPDMDDPSEFAHDRIDRVASNSLSINQTPDEDVPVPVPATINKQLDSPNTNDDRSFSSSNDNIMASEPSKHDIPSTHEKEHEKELQDEHENEHHIEEDFNKSVESEKKQLPTIDTQKDNTTIPPSLAEQPNLPPPSPVSHLQNELMLLNKQLTEFSIENENLKTKISKLEIMNNKRISNNGNNNNKNKNNNDSNDNLFQNISSNSNYIFTSLKHQNLIKYITEDGMIPESLVTELYGVITKFYQHIDGNKRNVLNPSDISGTQNFGERLFELLDEFYKIVLVFIELLEKADEKDVIVGLKSIFSHLVTTTKYFASYHHILPDIVIISTINECVFVITDVINMLKLKKDDLKTNTSKKESLSSINVFDRTTGVPMTPLAKITTTNNSGDATGLNNSPVKPLKIIEKVASSPLVNSTYEPKPMPSQLRKPSGNVLLSLNNMVKRTSNEKLASRSNSTNSVSSTNQSNESDSAPPIAQQKKSNNTMLVKKMSFSSSDEKISESESDDDDTNELLLKLKQHQGKESKLEPSALKNDASAADQNEDKFKEISEDLNSEPDKQNSQAISISSSYVTPPAVHIKESASDNVSKTIANTEPSSGTVPQDNDVDNPVSKALPDAVPVKTTDSMEPISSITNSIPTAPVKTDFKPMSPGLVTGSSSPSSRSPSFKPIRVTKLESSSLKKVDLSSKDKPNSNVTGLGIKLNKEVPNHSNSLNKADPVKKDDALERKIEQQLHDVNDVKVECNDDSKNGGKTENDDEGNNDITNTNTEQRNMLEKIPERNQKRNIDSNKSSNFSEEPIIVESDSDSVPLEEKKNVDPTNEIPQTSVAENSSDQINLTPVEKEVSNSPYIPEIPERIDGHIRPSLNSTPVDEVDHNRLISGTKPSADNNHSSDSIKVNHHHNLNSSPKSLENNDITLEDDSFQFIPLKSARDTISKKVPESIDEEEPELHSIVKPKAIIPNNDNDGLQDGGESDSDAAADSELESGTESEVETGSESESEFETEEEEEEEEDFDVDAFDIENPENTLSELLLYLEHQTVQVITTIQSLLTSIKEPKPTKGNLRGESNAINQVIRQMVDATSISMDQSRNANLKEHGSWVVQSLEDCSRRILILCELQKDGKFETLDNDNDFADKNFKQRLAGIAFDIAKCTKELVKTVEEASLKEEIEYLDSRIHK